MPGLLDFLNPQSQGLGAQPQQGLGFMGRAASFRDQNPGALTALGAGIMSGNPAAGFLAASKPIAEGRRQNATAQFLLAKGITNDPQEAMTVAQNPDLLKFIMKDGGDEFTKRAEAAARYGIKPDDPRYQGFVLGGDLQGPAEAKPPHLETLFDATGNEYKGVWNPATGGYDRMGGVKKTRDKVDEYTRKNRSLSKVVAPEVANLLGDGVAPGKFDALASAKDQYLETGGSAVKSLTGLDVTNYATGADYQSAKNSLKTIVASYLYSVSGATANPGEVETQTSVLLPRPGEDAASVADKKRRIKTMADAVQQAAQMSPDDMGGTVPPPGDDGGWTVEEVP